MLATEVTRPSDGRPLTSYRVRYRVIDGPDVTLMPGQGPEAIVTVDPMGRAIVAAGAIPWVLPCLPSEKLAAEAVRRCDGVMLTGGDDLEPKLYANHLPSRLLRTVSPPDSARDLSELLLIREVFRQRRAQPAKQELKNQLHAAGDHAAALELLRRLQTPNDRRGPDAPSGNGVGP